MSSLYESQCPACGRWGTELVRHYGSDLDDVDDVDECRSCGAFSPSENVPQRAIVSAMINRLVADAQRRLAEALDADVCHHLREMRGPGKALPLGVSGMWYDIQGYSKKIRLLEGEFHIEQVRAPAQRVTVELADDCALARRLIAIRGTDETLQLLELLVPGQWIMTALTPAFETFHTRVLRATFVKVLS